MELGVDLGQGLLKYSLQDIRPAYAVSVENLPRYKRRPGSQISEASQIGGESHLDQAVVRAGDGVSEEANIKFVLQ